MTPAPGPIIRALALWQPWATLVALGVKTVETRDWPPPAWLIGQRFAIHATKTQDWLHLCDDEPFSHYVSAERLPLGAIVATAVLARCAPITEQGAAELERRTPHEFAFGNYNLSEGPRWAWVLRDIQPIEPAVPFRGGQRIFNVPATLLPGVAQPAPAQGTLLPAGAPAHPSIEGIHRAARELRTQPPAPIETPVAIDRRPSGV
jgi:hypothetical protein